MTDNRLDDILEFDRKHIWHPYTSMSNPLKVYPVESARGVKLKLSDGRELIDGMSSWWCAVHGYNHPVLNDALDAQSKKMSHVMFGGVTHEPAVKLAEKLLQMVPENLQTVFFADSGSVSVEVAIKMALQYFQSVGQKDRNRLLTVRGGYHGDTFAAMSVCDPENGMHHLFSGILPEHFFVPKPTCRFDQQFEPASTNQLAEQLEKHADTIAAVIVEPVVQGAGGMWFYHPDYLVELRRLCDQYGVLLIFDEIATGFGRTGKMFACQWADVAPDIMCVGKALTGGYMTLAATLATSKISQTISSDGGVFMHGPTFMANPLACAVASASLDLLTEGSWAGQVNDIQKWLTQGLEPLRGNKSVADVRVLGAIGVVETKTPVNVPALQAYFVEKGVWIRPFNNLIYLMPPYIITQQQTQMLTDAIVAAVENNHI